jgi:ligand-binding sensor domain-containing protein
MIFIKMIRSTIIFFCVLTPFFSCNGQNQKLYEYRIEPTTAAIGYPVSELGKNIDCMLQDKNGNYWFASNGDGVYRYDNKTLLHITDKDGLCSNFVLAIQQDIHGYLWFSTRDGICQFDGKKFTNYTTIIKNAPIGRLQYKEGGLFFNHLNGVCFYDGNTFTNFVIYPGSYKPSMSDMNRPYSIYSTLIDNTGNVWFGTQSQGVCRYDGKTFTYLTDKNLAGPAVRTMFQDKAGNIWFGNNGGGLYRYDGKKLTNITEEKNLGNAEFLKGTFNDKPGSLARVWAINEDNDGNLWIGTIDAGVWKFDGTNLTNYTIKDGLPGNAIWAIYKDNKGELWYVTNGDAICTFNGQAFIKHDVPGQSLKSK